MIRKLGWFVFLYLAGLVTVSAVAAVLRMWIG